MSIASQETRSVVLLGAGGHAKVVLSLVHALGWHVTGVCDPAFSTAQEAREWRGVPILGDDAALLCLDPRAVALLNGVGQTTGGGTRQNLFEACKARGFHFPALVHPSASVDPSASLDEGVQVMAGAVIQADSRVGVNTIVNTRASVDHDGVIGAHVHIAPGATLCGGVQVGDGAFIGAGATVAPSLYVGRSAFLVAGALLSRNLPDARRWPDRSTQSVTAPQESSK